MNAMPTMRTLPAELTIYTMSELYPLCMAWAAADDDTPLCVSADAVDEVDAAGVQLLLSLRRTLAEQQRSLQLQRPSASLAAACGALGADCLLAQADLTLEAA